jgi:hypothetical protein
VNAMRAAYERHQACPPSAMVYDEDGAHCGSCGQSWLMTMTNDGRAVGYAPPIPTRRAAS